MISSQLVLSDSEDEENAEILYGHFTADIVGIRYYNGRVNNKEMVSLYREPLNQYDKNAIRVDNVSGQQVGHIKKEQAAVLAIVMDKKYAKVEGVVPFGKNNKFSMQCDISLYGVPGENMDKCFALMEANGYRLSGGVNESFIRQPSWGSSWAMSQINQQKKKPSYVANKFSAGKLIKLSKDKVNKELESLFENLTEVAKKLQSQEPSQVVKTSLYPHQKQALWWMSSCENSTDLPPFWTFVDKWYCNSCTNFMTETRPSSLNGGLLADDMGVGKTLSMIALIATNYRHKKPLVDIKSQSTKRKHCDNSILISDALVNIPENDDKLLNSPQNENISSYENLLHPNLEDNNYKVKKMRINKSYKSRPTNKSNIKKEISENNTVTIASSRSRRFATKKPCYTFSSDESGDELQSPVKYNLVHKNVCRIDKTDDSITDIAFKDSAVKNDTVADKSVKDNIDRENSPSFNCTRVEFPGPRATLIVCPVSVLSNWQEQIKTHLIENSLDVYTYYGNDKMQDPELLSKKDVVLTTYQTLCSDFKVSSTLHKVKWLRVILDESHVIRNTSTSQSKACLSLDAERRWLITGTPVQNSIKDLWSVVNFLRIEPFTKREWWTRSVERPIQNNEKGSIKRLQKLMSIISLRRTKSNKVDGKSLIKLPKKTIFIQKIKLTKEERDLYNMFKNEGRSILESYVKENSLNENFAHVLVVLMRLRQLCCHPKLCMQIVDFASKFSHSTSSTEFVKKLQQILSVLLSSGDEECPVCLDSLNQPVITHCAHLFCKQCIEDVIRTDKPKCPLCRKEVTKDKLVEPEVNEDNPSITCSEKWSSSSKVDTLITLLNKEREENGCRKHLVVSQFSSFLDLLEKPLSESHYKFVRLDGKMSFQQRNTAISLFSSVSDSSPTIMLLSLKAGGLGINLTKATRVFLMDPAWNPATEDQCFDRCHRLGQTEEVKIYKFIVEDSVEEKMLELQEKKRELMSNAFGKMETAKEKQKRRILDAQNLLDL
ncbi:helicase-like transcription factor isoform X1 [Hydra vulgaris]|uniref:helicase-like transcription factor isoform X1 n=1 Tax=Hydra vulgaris TaxID=6087 RepID=UPI001F5EAF39|nr:helicase-like transcription factor [Hydra vulgaris]